MLFCIRKPLFQAWLLISIFVTFSKSPDLSMLKFFSFVLNLTLWKTQIKCWLLCEGFSDLLSSSLSTLFFPLHHLLVLKDTFWLLNSLNIWVIPLFYDTYHLGPYSVSFLHPISLLSIHLDANQWCLVNLKDFLCLFCLFFVSVTDANVLQGKKSVIFHSGICTSDDSPRLKVLTVVN